MPSVAERTRRAMAERPHLLESLADGALNLAATARLLDIEGADETAVTAALRRMAAEPALAGEAAAPRVRVADGEALATTLDDAAAALGAIAEDDHLVCVEATGVDVSIHRAVLGRLRALDVTPRATVLVEATARYVLARDDLHTALAAIEQPVAIGRSVHSSGARENSR